MLDAIDVPALGRVGLEDGQFESSQGPVFVRLDVLGRPVTDDLELSVAGVPCKDILAQLLHGCNIVVGLERLRGLGAGAVRRGGHKNQLGLVALGHRRVEVEVGKKLAVGLLQGFLGVLPCPLDKAGLILGQGDGLGVYVDPGGCWGGLVRR